MMGFRQIAMTYIDKRNAAIQLKLSRWHEVYQRYFDKSEGEIVQDILEMKIGFSKSNAQKLAHKIAAQIAIDKYSDDPPSAS